MSQSVNFAIVCRVPFSIYFLMKAQERFLFALGKKEFDQRLGDYVLRIV